MIYSYDHLIDIILLYCHFGDDSDYSMTIEKFESLQKGHGPALAVDSRVGPCWAEAARANCHP